MYLRTKGSSTFQRLFGLNMAAALRGRPLEDLTIYRAEIEATFAPDSDANSCITFASKGMGLCFADSIL